MKVGYEVFIHGIVYSFTPNLEISKKYVLYHSTNNVHHKTSWNINVYGCVSCYIHRIHSHVVYTARNDRNKQAAKTKRCGKVAPGLSEVKHGVCEYVLVCTSIYQYIQCVHHIVSA